MGKNRLDGVERAVHIDRKDSVPESVGDILELALLSDARVVDQRLDGTQRRLHQMDGGGNGLPVRHVPLDGQGIRALESQFLDQSLRLLLGIQVVNPHCIALRCQAYGNSAANSPAAAGDKRGLLHRCQQWWPW